MVDKTAKPMKSFFVTPPFREGQSARPLSVGCGVSRRMGRLWFETSLFSCHGTPIPEPRSVRLCKCLHAGGRPRFRPGLPWASDSPDIPPERQALRENMHRGTGCADAVLREPQGTGHPGAERSEARPWASVVTPEHLRLACGCSGGVKPAGRKQARPAEIFNGRML